MTKVTQGRVHVWRALVLVSLVGAWWGLSALEGRSFLPSPRETAIAAVSMALDGTLWLAFRQSLFSLVAGYGLGVVVGIPAGLALGAFRALGATLEPYIDALSSMPRIAFLPLVIVFLGLGYEAKIFVVFLGAVMPILINSWAGVLNSDDELIEMARATGARRLDIFIRVVLPGAIPYVMSGLRIGASLALINTIVAELYTAVSGLGGLLAIYGNSFRMAPYFVVVAVLAGVGALLLHSVRAVETSLTHWRADARN